MSIHAHERRIRIGRKAFCFALLLVAIAGLLLHTTREQANAAAPPANPDDELKTVVFSLHPAKVPYAALQYRLLPTGMETTAGNAAENYFRAILVWANDTNYQAVTTDPASAHNSKLEDWLTLPLDQLAKNEAAQRFFNGVPTDHWNLISLAARCDHCDWELPVREMNISTPIPELIKLRDLGRSLAFKARIEISRGQVDNAIATFKTGFALARHAGQAPTLINSLVGAAINRMMLDQVAELIQQRKCPNLYWTLTALPNPIVDLRYGLEFEGHFLYLLFPELRDVRTATHTEAEWNKILFDTAAKLDETGLLGKKSVPWYGAAALAAVTSLPKAKSQLADAGYTQSQINKMPASQAILVAEVSTFEHLHNAAMKWFYADPPDCFRGMADVGRGLATQDPSKQEIIPFAKLMIPSLKKGKVVQVRTDRQVAALRVVEAIRLYAADNGDRLPTSLGQITSVPVPNDPLTGKPFAYELTAGTAVITSPSPTYQPPAEGLRWEIRLSEKK